jgi:autotransporter adhesin
MKKLLMTLAAITALTGVARAEVIAPAIPDLGTMQNMGDAFDAYLNDWFDANITQLGLGGNQITWNELGGAFDNIADAAYNSMQQASGLGMDEFHNLNLSSFLNQQISNYTNQINAEFAATNNAIQALDDKIEDQSKELSGGIAAATALTGLDNHLDEGKKYSIGVGAGYYNSQSAVALGGAIRTGGSHALNAGVSVGTTGQFSAKAGWNMQF